MNEQKRPYLKPELVEVPLRPEEAVLGVCKSYNSSQPGTMPCHGGPPPCNVDGS